MRIVQTFWTKPGLSMGWMDKQFNLMSWSLSCLQLRKFYNEVELYTDDLGKRVLIDILKLPYTRVHTTLNELNLPPYLWAIPKIHVYGLQESPFLHVDGDVYIWEKLKIEESSGLICQNKDVSLDQNSYYARILANVLKQFKDCLHKPGWLNFFEPSNVEGLNAGIFGGTDLSFFKTHCKTAFDFIKDYLSIIERLHSPQNVNILIEQVLARVLALSNNIAYTSLLPDQQFGDMHDKNMHSSYIALNHFGVSPLGNKYIHLPGLIKWNLQTCKMIARRLLLDYPLVYQKITDHFPVEAAAYDAPIPEYHQVYPVAIAELPKTNALSLAALTAKQNTRTVFHKTFSLFEYFTNEKLHDDLRPEYFEEYFSGKLKHFPVEEKRETMEDVFHYELEKYTYAMSVSNNEDYLDKEHRYISSIDKVRKADQTGLDTIELRLNPNYAIISSKWNWAYKEKLPDLLSTARENKRETITVMAADVISLNIAEINMTKFSQLILYVFQNWKLYGAGCEEIIAALNKPATLQVKQKIFESIVYLITSNILQVKC
jgi:hypothetical protein